MCKPLTYGFGYVWIITNFAGLWVQLQSHDIFSGIQWWLRQTGVDQVAFNTSLDVLKARITGFLMFGCLESLRRKWRFLALFGGSPTGRHRNEFPIAPWALIMVRMRVRQVSWIHALSLLWKMSQVLLQMDVLSVNAVSRPSGAASCLSGTMVERESAGSFPPWIPLLGMQTCRLVEVPRS